jgi:hypothetical protein
VSFATQVLLRWELDCGFFQPARPPCTSHLLPLNQWGRMMESPATTQNSNCQHTILQNKYSTTLLEEFTSWDIISVTFNFFDTFACHISRPPRRRRETSLQASRWILDEGHIGQPRTAESGPQLESLLQRFPVLLIRRIFNGGDIVTFADFTMFLGLGLPSSGISTCRGGGGLGRGQTL